MSNRPNMKKTTTVALFLVLAIAVSLFALPTTIAQTTRVTYAFIGALPNPVGVGQEVLLHVGITHPCAWPQTGWKGLTVTVTKPDGTTQTLGPVDTDTTGGTGVAFIPTTVGTYKFQTNFPQQLITTTAYGTPANSTMLASKSGILELIVQTDPIPYRPGVSLPTEYWTRPIDAQYREWNTIAGNWLGYFRGSDTSPTSSSQFKDYTTAPETGHILWAKPLVLGGLAGGLEVGPQSYDHGDAYEGRWTNPVIINGMVFFNKHQADGGTRLEQEVVALDLRTGKEIWTRNWNNTRLSFGQVYYHDNFNQHSVYAYLWSVVGTTWNAYDPFTGRWVWGMTAVPAGNNIYGPDGNIYRHVVNLAQGWMTQWNLSKVVEAYRRTIYADYAINQARGSWIRENIGLTFNASVPLALDWNVTIPRGLPGAVRKVRDGVILGSNFARGDIAPNPATIWALSTAKGREGQLLFNVSWTVPYANVHMSIEDASPKDDVFNIAVQETQTQFGFSLSTGRQIWGPSEPQRYQDQYGFASGNRWDVIADGRLFSGNWGGTLYCYDVKSGKLLWTYDNTDPYNEILWGNLWPLRISFIADGKVYLEHHEHSPTDPLPRGAPFVCLNATTGEVIFRMTIRGTEWGATPAIADGIIAMFNTYDCRLYAIGKGPSKTTVMAPEAVQPFGASILIKGYVTDISPGTADYALTARFPNGVPAVSDESMSKWMEYVYMQAPKPKDASGVEVMLSVLDSNGNYREIGKTTSEANGFYSLMWTPDIPGKYTLYASFAGSKSYWPSQAETAFGVDEALPPQETPETPVDNTPSYIMYAAVAVIVAVVIVGAIIVVITLRKR